MQEENRRDIEKQGEAEGLLNKITVEPSLDYNARLWAKIEKAEAGAKIRKRVFFLSFTGALTVAAGLLIIALIPIDNSATHVYSPEQAKSVSFSALTYFGEIMVTSEDRTRTFNPKEEIKEGDIIETKAISAVDLAVNKSSIRLKSSSKLRIRRSYEQLGIENIILELEKGAMLCSVKKKDKALRFAVFTPQSEVVVKGTAFKVSVLDEFNTNVFVASGKVLVNNKSDPEIACSVAGGKGVSVSKKTTENKDSSLLPRDLTPDERNEIEEIKNIGLGFTERETETVTLENKREQFMTLEKEKVLKAWNNVLTGVKPLPSLETKNTGKEKAGREREHKSEEATGKQGLSEKFLKYGEARKKGDLKRAVAEGKALIDSEEGSLTENAFVSLNFQVAENAMKSADYDIAEECFANISRISKNNRYLAAAGYGTVCLEELREKNPDTALAGYERLLKEYKYAFVAEETKQRIKELKKLTAGK